MENSALNFLKSEVTTQMNERADQLLGIHSPNPNLIQQAFLAKYEKEVPILREEMANALEKAATHFIETKNGKSMAPNLFHQFLVTYPVASELNRYEVFRSLLNKFGNAIPEIYQQTWQSLLSDIRFFSTVNLGSFLLILFLTVVLKKFPAYVSACAWILLISTCISISIYLYGQNWFYTILFNEYYGTGYLTLLTCIFSYLLFRIATEYLFIQTFERKNTPKADGNSGSR